jgi:antitoxin HicB
MKNFGFIYPAELRVTKGTVLVRFPDLPEALTEGESEADALLQAADCLEEAIAGRIRRGDEIPKPSRPHKRHRMIAVPPPTAGKAALHIALLEAKMSPDELANRLGCREKEIRHLLDPRRASELPRLQQALAQLGKRLVVEMRAA